MKKFIIVAAAAFSTLYANAQEVILSSQVTSPAGGYFENLANDITISSTVGEMIVTTISNGDIILTQGFQQPDMPTNPTLVENATASGVTISAYPNPFTETFYTVVKLDKNEKLTFSLTDLSGRVVNFEKVFAQDGGQAVYTFNTGSVAAGLYNLTVRSESGSFAKTLKLSKVN